jgi:hypothetical protein
VCGHSLGGALATLASYWAANVAFPEVSRMGVVLGCDRLLEVRCAAAGPCPTAAADATAAPGCSTPHAVFLAWHVHHAAVTDPWPHMRRCAACCA